MVTANITAHTISLADLVGGAVDEAFQHELTKVLQNIRDLNTVAKDKRKLTIELVIAPTEGRDYATVDIKVKSTAGGQHNEPLVTSLVINGNDSTVSASERFAEQKTIFDQ